MKSAELDGISDYKHTHLHLHLHLFIVVFFMHWTDVIKDYFSLLYCVLCYNDAEYHTIITIGTPKLCICIWSSA